ncbi:hypothetical protein MKX03_018471, partial [Papaver bracteatum]
SQIIDLDAIEYINPTPPEQKPLKEAKSIELWDKCIEQEQEILKEFCKDAKEG